MVDVNAILRRSSKGASTNHQLAFNKYQLKFSFSMD
jgi:hypothetical protein